MKYYSGKINNYLFLFVFIFNLITYNSEAISCELENKAFNNNRNIYKDLVHCMENKLPFPSSVDCMLKNINVTREKIDREVEEKTKTIPVVCNKIIDFMNRITEEIMDKGLRYNVLYDYTKAIKDNSINYNEEDFRKEIRKTFYYLVKNEIDNKDYFVLYSSNPAEASFLYDIYTLLYAKKNKLQFNSEQKILRYNSPNSALKIKTALDLWNYLQSTDNPNILDKHAELTDCSHIIKDYMISSSKTLFINDFNMGVIESSIAAFLNRTAVRPIDLIELLKRFFNANLPKVDDNRIKDYIDLYEEYGQKHSGRVQQIFIKKSEESLFYLSEPFGFPSLIDRRPKEEYFGVIENQKLRTYKDSLPDEQMRILCDPIKFSIPGLVKIKEYGWGQFSDDTRKKLLEKLDELLSYDLDLM